jgi:hypothetical protein
MPYIMDRIADILGRLSGPLTLRLFLQPAMAVIAGLRAGLEDARAGRPAYFVGMLSDPRHRREMLADGWRDVAKVFVAAVVVDVIYQVIVFKWVYPAEALVVAFLLAAVPYVIVRGVVNRVARAWVSPPSRTSL